MDFVASLNLPKWASNVPHFSFTLNSTRRTAATNGLAYYRALIPALVQEAGGTLPIEVLYNAASRLENVTDTLELNENLPDNIAKKWQGTFREPIGADAFGSTLESLCETQGDVRLVGPRDALELQLVRENPISLDWYLLDAQILLSAQAIEEQQSKPNQMPETLIKKVLPFAIPA